MVVFNVISPLFKRFKGKKSLVPMVPMRRGPTVIRFFETWGRNKVFSF